MCAAARGPCGGLAAGVAASAWNCGTGARAGAGASTASAGRAGAAARDEEEGRDGLGGATAVVLNVEQGVLAVVPDGDGREDGHVAGDAVDDAEAAEHDEAVPRRHGLEGEALIEADERGLAGGDGLDDAHEAAVGLAVLARGWPARG